MQSGADPDHQAPRYMVQGNPMMSAAQRSILQPQPQPQPQLPQHQRNAATARGMIEEIQKRIETMRNQIIDLEKKRNALIQDPASKMNPAAAQQIKACSEEIQKRKMLIQQMLLQIQKLQEAINATMSTMLTQQAQQQEQEQTQQQQSAMQQQQPQRPQLPHHRQSQNASTARTTARIEEIQKLIQMQRDQVVDVEKKRNVLSRDLAAKMNPIMALQYKSYSDDIRKRRMLIQRMSLDIQELQDSINADPVIQQRRRPTPQEEEEGGQVVEHIKRDAMSRLNNMRAYSVPDIQRFEFNALLEQVYKCAQEMEPNLPRFACFWKPDAIRHVVTMILATQHQKQQLASPHPRYTLEVNTLRTMLKHFQAALEQYNNLTAVLYPELSQNQPQNQQLPSGPPLQSMYPSQQSPSQRPAMSAEQKPDISVPSGLQGMDPARLNEFMKYASVPAQELRARGIPEVAIKWIESHRPILQRHIQQQQEYRAGIGAGMNADAQRPASNLSQSPLNAGAQQGASQLSPSQRPAISADQKPDLSASNGLIDLPGMVPHD